VLGVPAVASLFRPIPVGERTSPSSASLPPLSQEGTNATTRITAEAIQELQDYFKAKKYPRNKTLPRAGGELELDAVILKHSLNRSQVARQLLGYKKKNFEYSTVVFSHSKDELKKIISSHLPTEIEEFVRDVINTCIPIDDPGNRRAEDTFRWDFCETKEWGAAAFHTISANINTCKFLCDVVDEYAGIGAKYFPSTHKMKKSSEFSFVNARIRSHKNLKVKWMDIIRSENLECTGAGADYPVEVEWTRVFLFLEEQLFLQWAALSEAEGLPPIRIPENGGVATVHPHSQPVVCFTAGWILAAMVNTTKNRTKAMQNDLWNFSQAHSISPVESQKQGVPTSLIERREMKRLHRPSFKFFEFVCRIESIFMENFTVDMMVAYSTGNLVNEIAMAIQTKNEILQEFRTLYDNYVTDAAARKVLSYMLDKYAHMRGRWFVKSINAQEGNTLEVVDKLPTRAGVGAAVKASKAAAEAIRKATTNLVAEPMAEPVTDLIGQMYNEAEQTILVSEPDIFTVEDHSTVDDEGDEEIVSDDDDADESDDAQ